MRPPEEVKRELVRQWIERAEQDLGLADYLMAHDAPWLNAVAYHAQQAAEKFLKGFLVRHQIEFAKTHAIGQLLDLVATADTRLADALGDAVALTAFSTAARYPSDIPEVTREDARKAVALAAKVRASVLDLLHDFVAEAQG